MLTTLHNRGAGNLAWGAAAMGAGVVLWLTCRWVAKCRAARGARERERLRRDFWGWG